MTPPNEEKRPWFKQSECETCKETRAQLKEAREVLDKYVKAMDAIYNHDAVSREAVVKYFGVLHPQAALRQGPGAG